MKRMVLLLSLLVTACGGRSTAPATLPTPDDAMPTIVATGAAKDGSPITIAVVPAGYTHRMRVSRGESTFWLQASDSPNRFGCEGEYPRYDTFGCYFYLQIWLADLDGEAEIISWWEHDGTGGYKSLHLHRWDGSD